MKTAFSSAQAIKLLTSTVLLLTITVLIYEVFFTTNTVKHLVEFKAVLTIRKCKYTYTSIIEL